MRARRSRSRLDESQLVFGRAKFVGHRDDDVDELIDFARELSSITRLTLTFSTFVAKRNTPMDGQPFVGQSDYETVRRIETDKLRRRCCRTKRPRSKPSRRST